MKSGGFAALALVGALAWAGGVRADGPPAGDLLPREGAANVGPVDAAPPGRSPEDRLDEIRRRIQAALVYPAAARRRGFEGVSSVRFEIGADGRAQGIEVVRTSGYPALDRAARRSVVDAGVLPYVYGRIQVPVSFSLDAEG